MQSKEFAAPFEKVMILQIVLNLKKRLQELPSAGYALSGRKAEHTFILQAMLLAGDVLPIALFFGPMQRHVASKVRKMAQQGRRTCVVEDTHLNTMLRRRELNRVLRVTGGNTNHYTTADSAWLFHSAPAQLVLGTIKG